MSDLLRKATPYIIMAFISLLCFMSLFAFVLSIGSLIAGETGFMSVIFLAATASFLFGVVVVTGEHLWGEE